MEITKENFAENLPKIKQSIRNADFVAIDCELTGLNDGIKINQYDTPKQYYEKVRSSSMDFMVIQYGLCMFRYDDNLKGFKQQGYNFYIFPTISNKYTPDHRFLCQTSSINFLISHGFDFNKVFKEGISYLTRAEETSYKDLLVETQKTRNQNQNVPKHLSSADKEIVDNIFEKIEEFIISNDEEMQLPQCNSYIRRIVYNEAISKLENRASLETRKIGDIAVFFVTKWKSKDKEAEENKKIQAENEELEKCKGFSEVIKCIVESGKLIVGHNMLLDFLHTIDKFLHKLPANYEDFKSMANCLFANLLDTKYMSSSTPFRNYFASTALPNLLDSVKMKPFQIPTIEIEENGVGYDLNCGKGHEAGYDAYITGLCFLAMWNNLGKPNSTEHLKDFSVLAPYKNRLFLMRLLDYPFIYLGGIDPLPSRDHVLYLTFPEGWNRDDICNLFNRFGGVDNVAWIDKKSAYVGLLKQDQVGPVLRSLSKDSVYQISTFANQHYDGKTQNPIKRKISNTESNVKERKTDTIEDNVAVASKNTYASVAAKSPSVSSPTAVSRSPTPTAVSRSPTPTAVSRSPTPVNNTPSLVHTNKKEGEGKCFKEPLKWD